MRDDARKLTDELSRLYDRKLNCLQKLLLSESDKHHYEKIDNLDKISELIREDARTIEEINITDYDIARTEASLAGLIGIKTGSLYDVLSDGVAEAAGLIAARKQAREILARLNRERAELAARMGAGAERLLNDMDDLSRISRLKPVDGD